MAAREDLGGRSGDRPAKWEGDQRIKRRHTRNGQEEGLVKGILVCLLMLCFVAASSAAEPTGSASPERVRCPVCGMFVEKFPDWNARIEFKDSAYAVFDGAKDMFKYYLNLKQYAPSKQTGEVAAVSVKDFYSKSSIDASKAFYVIWSDLYGPMGHEPIPFEREADAKKFMKEHRGKRVLKFKEITPRLIRSLDNP